MSVDPAQLHVVPYPHPILRRKADPIDPAAPVLPAVAKRMLQLMRDHDGVGLAATQVGLPWRMFVTNGREVDPHDRVFVNPVLVLERGEIESAEEGCLSLPGIHVQVRRPLAARIEATGLDGAGFAMSAAGMLARIWQHEMDHLDGVMIIDRMSPLDRLSMRRALRELEAAAAAFKSA